jgi:cytochrome c-type biogenesis protein CcmF
MALGDILIYLALLLSAGAIPGHILALRAGKKKEAAAGGRRIATILMAGALLTTVAAWALLTYYFVTSDMSYALVHSLTSKDLAEPYKISAVWAGGEGSFLLWVIGMQIGLVAARLLFSRTEAGRTKEGRRLQDLNGIIGGLMVVMFLGILYAMDPFRPTDLTKLALNPDGMGLNILLQHPLMAVHPMMALIGYGLSIVTFVSSVAFLLTGNRHWAVYSLPFSRAFFLIFSAALAIGGLWAYETLGWGGYWGWDPVETSSLLPWLMGAVVCHCQVQYVKRRDSLLLGAAAAFFLLPVILFATFAARSGLWTSVHAYAATKGDFWTVVHSSGFLTGIFSLTVILCILGPLMLARAWMFYYEEGPKEKKVPLARILSRRSNAMLFGSVLILMGLLVTVFIMLMRLGSGLDPQEFEVKLGPLALIMVSGLTLFYLGVKSPSAAFPLAVLGIGIITGLVAMALYPDEPLGAFSIPFLTVAIVAAVQYLIRVPKARSQRQRLHDTGAAMIHLGLILLLLGYSGSTFFAHEETLNLSQDVPIRFEGYDLVLVDMNQTADHVSLVIEVKVNGAVQGVARPDVSQVQGQLRSEVSIVRFLDKDLYIIITDINKVLPTGEGARAQVTVKALPGINALWCGAAMVITGTALRFVWTAPEDIPPTRAKRSRPLLEEE